MAAGVVHEGHEGVVFQQSGAGRVDDRHLAHANGVEQTRYAKSRVGAEFQWVAEIVVDAAQDDVHLLQTLDGFEPHETVTHQQVVALRQDVAVVSRQVGVFEVGLVVGTGREIHNG